MTTSIEQQLEAANRKLLQASIDLLEKDKIIAALQSSLALQDKQLAAVQGQMRRATVAFNRDINHATPALLRPQI